MIVFIIIMNLIMIIMIVIILSDRGDLFGSSCDGQGRKKTSAQSFSFLYGDIIIIIIIIRIIIIIIITINIIYNIIILTIIILIKKSYNSHQMARLNLW